MSTDHPRDPEDWHLYSAAGAYAFMVHLHESGIPAEQASQMMRDYGRKFVEEADLPPDGDAELWPL